MEKTRITAVCYLNTIPFIHGIRSSGMLQDFQLDLQVPSVCGLYMKEGKADIALVPSGVLPGIEGIDIVTNYCLGADGVVDSVLFVSDAKPQDVEVVYLDQDSMTSVRLAKILFHQYWHADPEFKIGIESYPGQEKNHAAIVIGDKAEAFAKDAAVVIDLAEAWKNMTGLPFVFAVWTARNTLAEKIINDLDRSLDWGVNHIDEAIREYHSGDFSRAHNYLTQRIKYDFGTEYHKALMLYLELVRKAGL